MTGLAPASAPPMPNERTDELLLAIDCGTQSVRALLVDLRGHIAAKCQADLTGYVSARPGWMEHDADAFWLAVAQVCQGLWIDHAALRARVKGIAVTTQRGTLVPLDAAGRPLRDFIIWLDPRRASQAVRFSPWWRLAFRLAGVSGTIAEFTRAAELNWIAEHEPGLLERTHKVLLLSGWLNYRLTGRMADSVASQVGYLPLDFKRQRWAAGWDWKWQALPLRREQLPELLGVGEPIGGLTREAAAATGLTEGLPVIAAAADKACEIAGAGAITPEIGALSFATAATVAITTPRYTEASPFVPAYPALLPGQYNTEVQIFRGYWMVAWFKQQFGQIECAAAAAAGVWPETLLDRLAAAVPAGSDGLIVQPYWSPGLRHPGPDARGAAVGFTDIHTRAHLYRAILEGLSYALREGKELIEGRSHVPITSLRASGGGSQSDTAMQLTADIFDLPTARPHTYETSGLGAAIAAAVGLGLHRDFPGAVAEMTRLGRCFEPVAANVAGYEALYRGVYRRLYGQLEPLYAALAKVAPRSA